MLKIKRKSYAFGHCLSTTTSSKIVDFDMAGLLGGIVRDEHQSNKDLFKPFAQIEGITRFLRPDQNIIIIVFILLHHQAVESVKFCVSLVLIKT